MSTRFSRPRIIDVVTQTVVMNAPKPSDVTQAKTAVRDLISSLLPVDRIAVLTFLLSELTQAAVAGLPSRNNASNQSQRAL